MSTNIWRLDKPEQFIQQIRWTCDENENGCWIWPDTAHWSERSHPTLTMSGKRMTIGRWILWAITGELQQCARHKCDVGHCCNPDHLEWGTHSDNSQDMWDRERRSRPIGEKSPTSKLNSSDIMEIRQYYAESDIPRKYGVVRHLAEKYSVSPDTISNVVRRITWKHLP